MSKILDLAKAELAKKDDVKAVERLEVAVAQQEINARQEIFNGELAVKKAEAMLNSVEKEVSSSLQSIVDARDAVAVAKRDLEAIKAVAADRF